MSLEELQSFCHVFISGRGQVCVKYRGRNVMHRRILERLKETEMKGESSGGRVLACVFVICTQA